LPPIVACCYSRIFKQVISVHVDGTCVLWNVADGTNNFEFKMDHRDSITTAAIDEVGKRLLTASQNGVIRMWNFNNGAVMHEFEPVHFEVTRVIYLPSRTLHCVVGCGYNPLVVRWPSHQAPPEANFILQNKLHRTDVRAMCTSDEYLLTGSSDGMIVEWHIDSNVRSEVFHCPAFSVAITAMAMAKLEGKWHLFVGTDEGIVHIFQKRYHYKLVCSISEQHTFKEAILEMAANDAGSRLMIADCVTMKLFDIQNLHKEDDHDYLLMKEWKPHSGCITSLLYIPGFDVFSSASDNGELVLWNLEGVCVGQFGRSDSEWNLSHSDSMRKSSKTASAAQLDSTGDPEDVVDENGKERDRENVLDGDSTKRTKRKSYFDDHSIYRPKLISSVVTESMNRTLFGDRHVKETVIKEKSKFEESLDKLVGDLMNPAKKRKRNYMNRRLSTVSKRSSITSNFSVMSKRSSTLSSNSKSFIYRSGMK